MLAKTIVSRLKESLIIEEKYSVAIPVICETFRIFERSIIKRRFCFKNKLIK